MAKKQKKKPDRPNLANKQQVAWNKIVPRRTYNDGGKVMPQAKPN